MRAPQDGGSRVAIVFNGSPLFTGDAGGGESEIRRWIIENDWLEAIVALPEQLFYNTGIPTYLWVLTNRNRSRARARSSSLMPAPSGCRWRRALGTSAAVSGTLPMRRQKGPRSHRGNHQNLRRLPGWGHPHVYRGRPRNPPVQRKRVVSKVFDNEDFGYHKITVERPLRLNFQASAERIARLDDESRV